MFRSVGRAKGKKCPAPKSSLSKWDEDKKAVRWTLWRLFLNPRILSCRDESAQSRFDVLCCFLEMSAIFFEDQKRLEIDLMTRQSRINGGNDVNKYETPPLLLTWFPVIFLELLCQQIRIKFLNFRLIYYLSRDIHKRLLLFHFNKSHGIDLSWLLWMDHEISRNQQHECSLILYSIKRVARETRCDLVLCFLALSIQRVWFSDEINSKEHRQQEVGKFSTWTFT